MSPIGTVVDQSDGWVQIVSDKASTFAGLRYVLSKRLLKKWRIGRGVKFSAYVVGLAGDRVQFGKVD